MAKQFWRCRETTNRHELHELPQKAQKARRGKAERLKEVISGWCTLDTERLLGFSTDETNETAYNNGLGRGGRVVHQNSSRAEGRPRQRSRPHLWRADEGAKSSG